MLLRLPLILLLPAALGAAPMPSNADGNALLECRQTREGADTVRKTLKEISHSGSPGGYEYIYDVSKLRPFGTTRPRLILTQYENQYGSLDSYSVVLNGQYPAVLKKLLAFHGRSACEKSVGQTCSFSAGETEVELAVNARKELVLTCNYEEDN